MGWWRGGEEKVKEDGVVEWRGGEEKVKEDGVVEEEVKVVEALKRKVMMMLMMIGTKEGVHVVVVVVEGREGNVCWLVRRSFVSGVGAGELKWPRRPS
ncbi:hypothetical protein Pcinc_025930 [Petrolisthes cinctipes]|uniref:Uncharacterized protein n=1 Tax=Petrolisthes cinctipes TaxID=88211 RepID=A0AAE1F706_PETCI|nr:hypothetical protein Pcinc_025930 [Petrolisthes cinctipes]